MRPVVSCAAPGLSPLTSGTHSAWPKPTPRSRRFRLAADLRQPPAAGSGRPGNLTERQAEVLRLLAAGLSNKQIAAELYLSTATVERHLATIYRNLGLTGRVEAARFAIENGIADPVPRRCYSAGGRAVIAPAALAGRAAGRADGPVSSMGLLLLLP